jgi:hypothetical protein
MLDFTDKLLYLKQKGSCKYFEIIVSKMIKKEGGDHHWEFDTFPNIAELFDLFPYVMYFNRTVEIDGVSYNEFKYSYPLGKEHNPGGSEFLMYFTEDTMDLNRITM